MYEKFSNIYIAAELRLYETICRHTEQEAAADLAKRASEVIVELMKERDDLNAQYTKVIYEVMPRWIPVTERLPESVCKSYLCLTDTGYHCEVRWTNNVYGLWKSDNKWGWSIADVPQYCKVTHWMPLPEPPKEEWA